MFIRNISLAFLLCLSFMTTSRAQQIENLFLITLDGLRWEELYGGADSMLISNLDYVKDTTELKDLFWASTAAERRQKLLPFFWSEMAQQGQLYGNRKLGSKVNCSNIFWFSYPGYAEILVGKTNANAIHSNQKVQNPDTSFLELLHQRPSFQGQIAAFGSWDVFPFILNEERSGIPVNAGFEMAAHARLSDREIFLNELQDQVPSPWAAVRLDAFTHHYAVEYIQEYHPKVVYLAYGETDDFAHDGRYDHYLKSAHQTDVWIASLWDMVQSDTIYRDKTALVITTDHGRGSYMDGGWKSHGKTIQGSNAIWIAMMGPGIDSLGEVRTEQQLWQNQVAASCLQLLYMDDLIQVDMGKPIPQAGN